MEFAWETYHKLKQVFKKEKNTKFFIEITQPSTALLDIDKAV